MYFDDKSLLLWFSDARARAATDKMTPRSVCQSAYGVATGFQMVNKARFEAAVLQKNYRDYRAFFGQNPFISFGN